MKLKLYSLLFFEYVNPSSFYSSRDLNQSPSARRGISIRLISIFVLFPWCTTYSDPTAGRRKTDLHPTTGRKKNDLDTMIDILREEVGVKKIQNFGCKKQFSFKQDTFLHQIL